MKIRVVLPLYNERPRIKKVLQDLLNSGYSVVVVDDGSTDRSLDVIKNLQKINKSNLVVIEHKINLGKGAALKTGCDYAFSKGADAVILMDSDGQHSIDDLPLFLKILKESKYDVVLGSRNLSMGIPLVRYIGNKVASIVVSLMYGIYISDLISGYRALTKKAYKAISWESSDYGVETEMIIRMKKQNLSYCEIPVTTIYYDGYKGVSILDSFGVLFNLFLWKFKT